MRRAPQRPPLAALTAAGATVVVSLAGMVALATPAGAADCATVSCTVSYRGGGLQTSPRTHLVRWQLQNSQTDPVQWDAAHRFLVDVDGSGYLAPLTQYSVPSAGQKVTGTATFGGSVVLAPTNTATSLSDTDVQTELKSAVDREDLPPASWRDDYVVMFPPGYTVTTPTGEATVCGYHNQTVAADGTTPIRYAVIPDLDTATARAQCLGGTSSSPTTNLATGAVSDQLVQLITDPGGAWGGVGTQTGWYGDAGGEIGDTCSGAPVGSVGGQLVHPYWSNTAHACVFGTSRITFPSPPPAWTTSSAVTATFTSTDVYGSHPTFTCALDGGTAKACSSDTTIAYTGLVTGTHTIVVRGTDAGHSLGSATARFIVDQTVPAPALAALPPFTGASAVTLALGGSDTGTGIASYDVRMRSASYTARFTGWTTPAGGTGIAGHSYAFGGLLPGVDYCFSIRATDGAGHVSGWTAARCVSRLLDDRAAKASAGWSAGTGSAYYSGTYRRTTRKGAALTVAGFSGDRIGLLARTCAKCGSVDVYVGSTLIKSVSLVSKKAVASRLIVLPVFKQRSGTVRLVTTSAKPVVVDGLGLSRT